MQLIERTRSLLLSPRATWPAVAEYPDTPAQVLGGHVAPLAALSALAAFIGYSLVGVGAFGFSARVPVLGGLAQMAISFVLTLVMVGVLAWLIQWLAPRFGGTADLPRAVKLAGYSATAGLLGGVFQIVPALGMLGLLAALYSLYLLYTGLPVLMKNRPEDTLKYTALVVLAAVVCGVLIGVLGSLLSPRGLGGVSVGRDIPASIRLDTPGGQVSIDTRDAEAWGKRAEQAAEKMKQAQTQGDTQASAQAAREGMEAAVGAVASMLGGTGGVRDPKSGQPPATAEQLVAVLPSTLAELPRQSLKQRTSPGLNVAEVRAVYSGDAGRQLEVSLTHHRVLGQAARIMQEEKNEDAERVNHKRRDARSGWFIDEDYARDGSRAGVTVILPNGAQVQLEGQGMGREAVQAALESLPMAQMSAW
ncbi:MAG: YIP1 family protein [Proteobacteria bacterium]|jgi:hypothetical protein|nr:YIP1 family protein [Pseudomonadota bacterium]